MIGDVQTAVDFFQRFADKLRRLSPTQKAKSVAYYLAPGLILGVAIIFGGGLSVDFGRGAAISELKTEITGAGGVTSRRGVVLIAEPVESEYQIPLAPNGSRIWSSLDEELADYNVKRGRLALDARGLYGKTPFIGVDSPVTLVVEGNLGGEINIAGSAESVERWRLSSRQSGSVVSGVIINCFLALGIGVATGSPPVGGDKDNASQVGAEPDKD